MPLPWALVGLIGVVPGLWYTTAVDLIGVLAALRQMGSGHEQSNSNSMFFGVSCLHFVNRTACRRHAGQKEWLG